MVLQALLEVQMGLLHPLTDGPHLQLNGGHGLMHGGHELWHSGHRHLHIAHSPLKSSNSLHDLRNIDLWLRRRDCLRGWSHVWKSNGIAAGISSSESSLRSYALDFIKVCLLRGCFSFILGYPFTSMPDWRMIWSRRQPKGSPALFSSRASSMTPKICLQR